MIRSVIIIVNWNGIDYLRKCMPTVMKQSASDYVVIVVDNGSTDGSSDFLRSTYSTVRVVQLDENTGFAGGNNIGITVALSEYDPGFVVLLNNDTVLREDWLEQLEFVADQYPRAGSVASKMIFDTPARDTIDNVGIGIHADGSGKNRGSRELDDGQYDEVVEIFGASGGAVLYRAEMIKDIQSPRGDFFDSIFFAYYEDVDVAWRARLRGWESYAAPAAVVYHVHSGTAGVFSPFKSFHMNRNRFFVILKNYPVRYLSRALFIMPQRYVRMLLALVSRQDSHLSRNKEVRVALELKERYSIFMPFIIVLRVFCSLLWYLPAILSSRFFIQRSRLTNKDDVARWFNNFSL